MKLRLSGREAGLDFQNVHLVPGRGKCSGLHPHFHSLSVTVEGELSERGMLVHLYRLKEAVRALCEELDHRVLLADYPPAVMQIREEDAGYQVEVNDKRYFLPRQDVVRLPIGSLNVEDLCRYLTARLADALDPILDRDRLTSLTVELDEGGGQAASLTVALRG
ncbi:MAG: 6-carboxytetrahydropterin synthase [Thermaerobacter sp.]|jgi:6-pyruvoyl-tetrahydropterin synthase|nr:6-carboxytetrahydropterin synthase [Thermaerobacter sp.]